MTIERVHVVYPHGPRASTPDAIGRELGRRLEGEFEVVFHDWADFERIPASRSAALVGHAHPVPGTTFRRSAQASGWGRRVLLQPFVTGLDQIGYIAGVLPHVDHFVAITGRYWKQVLPSTLFAPIAPAFTQLDLALHIDDFPMVVSQGRPPGERRLLYVGRDVTVKNLGYLEELARRRPNWTFAHIGAPRGARPGIQQLGEMDFRTPESLDVLSSFDILLTVSTSDANPTTVLEAMAWGLLPVCTPQSGYDGYDGVANIPLGDPEAALATLDMLQSLPDAMVAERRALNRLEVEEIYNWDHFTSVVRRAIVEPGPPLRPPLWWRRWAATARWWMTAPRASNRAGLTDSARNLGRRVRRRN